MKGQYSSATTMNLELCVMIYGMTMMQMLCANSLDMQVSIKLAIFVRAISANDLQQMVLQGN